MEQDELTPQERAARATYDLLCGGQFTTMEAGAMYGLTYYGARRMLNSISRVVPMGDEGGRWRMYSGTTGNNQMP